MLRLAIIFFSLISSIALTSAEKVKLPAEVKQEIKITDDDLIKGKQWNRWTSGRFVVCSINDAQAKYLSDNLESIKTWALTRWGLPDVPFARECRMICVDDPELYKKFFNLDQSRVEIRSENSKVKMYVLFMLLNDRPSQLVPGPVTEVCLYEYEQVRSVRLGLWAQRGMISLNNSLSQIRSQLKELPPVTPIPASKILTVSEEQYGKKSPQERTVFDRTAAALCLMLRKELGQDKFLQFIHRSDDPEAALRKVYGYKGFEEFDKTFGRYVADLAKDLSEAVPGRRTPDSYLQIIPKR